MAFSEKNRNGGLFGEKLDSEVFSLSPAQLEILCYEFLRSKQILKSLMLPIGRSLPHIDIFGITPNKKNIIAQVTFSDNVNDIKEKFELLRRYKSPRTILIFFGREKHKIKDKEVKYFSIESVFDNLNRKTDYKFLLERMLNGNLTSRSS